jgi:hypothetical protein
VLLAKIGKYDRIEYFCKGVSIEPGIRPNFCLIQTAEGPRVIAWVDAAFGRANDDSFRFGSLFDNICDGIVESEWCEEVE